MTSNTNTPSFTLKATADINVCRFVKISASDTGGGTMGSAAADRTLFISDSSDYYPPGVDSATAGVAGPSGKSCKLYGPGSVAMLELGTGGCTVGDGLVSDASGKGVVVTATAGRPFWAYALETGVAGDRVRVFLQPGVVTS